MSNKHTPGPWTIGSIEDAELPGHIPIDAISRKRPHLSLAQVVWKMEDDERSLDCEANARLIAAAPELLAALERVARLNPDSGEIGDGMLITIVSEARAAIAKATWSGT